MKKLIFACLVFTILSNTSLYSQQACTDTNAIYTFEYDGKNYAIVKDGITWNDATNCTNELGGTLAHIDSQAEQNAIWAEIPNANINNSSTTATDDGNASYLWLGGSDATDEGK